MSKNNTIRKSDKKFIRSEKARIRVQFFDVAKQEEMIVELYKRFIPKQASQTPTIKEKLEVKTEVKAEPKVEDKKEKAVKTKKVVAKKEKVKN